MLKSAGAQTFPTPQGTCCPGPPRPVPKIHRKINRTKYRKKRPGAPKWTPKDSKIEPKWRHNGTKMEPKLPKWSQNGAGSHPKDPTLQEPSNLFPRDITYCHKKRDPKPRSWNRSSPPSVPGPADCAKRLNNMLFLKTYDIYIMCSLCWSICVFV